MTDRPSFTVFDTRLGAVALAWNALGICSLRLPARTMAAAESALLRRLPDAIRDTPPTEIHDAVAAITRYFDGERTDFSAVPVDLGRQDAFVASVYAAVRKLQWGETTTYGAVARALGAEPMAARDVGQAMATNPVPLIVPCHRVLAAGGKIGGFSAPGGSATKARMLEIEGVTPPPAAAARTPEKQPIQTGFRFEGEPYRIHRTRS